MPSNARSRFNAKLLPDVNQLIETHRHLNPTGRGRRALGHITRSGVVMLCAAWEIYIEEIIEETATCVLSRATEHTELNGKFNTRLAKIVREHKNDQIALRLCGDGWRELYLEILREDVASLNTPKFGNISSLFNKWVGLEDCDRDWQFTHARLNEFVSVRGEISHRGADSEYVSISTLRSYKNMICDLVKTTDDRVCEHVRDITSQRTFPWRRTQ